MSKVSIGHALITGSSRGLGLSIAQTLQGYGYDIILNGTSDERLSQAIELLGRKTIAFNADVTCHDRVREMFAILHDRYSASLKTIVCNVGSGRGLPAGRENPVEWNRMLGLNLFSSTNIVEAVLSYSWPKLESIVCISSICGQSKIRMAPVTYSVSKAALECYVRSISGHLAQRGIRICGVAPGNILTEGSVWQRLQDEEPERLQDFLASNVDMRRLANMGEIAEIVAFLASSKSSFVTGTVWTADGGQT